MVVLVRVGTTFTGTVLVVVRATFFAAVLRVRLVAVFAGVDVVEERGIDCIVAHFVALFSVCPQRWYAGRYLCCRHKRLLF